MGRGKGQYLQSTGLRGNRIVCGQLDRDLIPLDIVVRWVIEVLGVYSSYIVERWS